MTVSAALPYAPTDETQKRAIDPMPSGPTCCGSCRPTEPSP